MKLSAVVAHALTCCCLCHRSASGKYHTVTCLDVMIHYPQDKADAMISHLASLAENRLIISFAPYTLGYAILKRIGELFPGPSKVRHATVMRAETCAQSRATSVCCTQLARWLVWNADNCMFVIDASFECCAETLLALRCSIQATRAYLHAESDVEAALERCGFMVVKREMTATSFYFSRLLEAVRQ